MSTEKVDVELHQHVALLQFSNPPHNYATVGLLCLVADALEQLDGNPEIRALVLTSDSKTFCAGADLISPKGFGAAGDNPLREFYDQALRIFASRKPIVAAIQGGAIGAGLGLAVAADFRVAAPEARFVANFVKLGFHPGFALTCTLPRLIGASRAAQMFLTAGRYRAEDVAAWGLVDRIAPLDELRQAALGLASEIAGNAPLALLSTRATLRAGLLEAVQATLRHELTEQLRLMATEDCAEGIRAVAERRPGKYVGR